MPNIFFFFLGLVSSVIGGSVSPTAFVAGEVTDVVVISPGGDTQPIVDAHVSGTSYLLLSGVHGMQSVEPKDGDSCTGETGTLMIGAVRQGPFCFAKGALAGRCAARFVAPLDSAILLWAYSVIDRRAVLYI